MTDNETASEREGVPAGAPEEGAAAPTAQTDPAATAQALSGEIAGLKDKVLRGLAEMENLRRRTEREVADARTYGVTSFAREMLTVADNLRRALDSVPDEARATAEGPLKALIEGIELTERDLLASLGRFGGKKLDPLGQKFDPNLHQAMYEVPDDSVPSGTVKQVAQAGYAIGDRVLRPALVGVSKALPKEAVEPAPANNNVGAK